MRDNYDFSGARKNPYAAKLKRPVTIRLDVATLDYFRTLADESSLPYQTLINLYLRDCAVENRRLTFVAAGRARRASPATRGRAVVPPSLSKRRPVVAKVRPARRPTS